MPGDCTSDMDFIVRPMLSLALLLSRQLQLLLELLLLELVALGLAPLRADPMQHASALPVQSRCALHSCAIVHC